ncbi:MAG TPA: FAD-binding oxidoreductase [Candidatus Acidoferrales bacterium]|nr:FAD-binding oxidoreductase [Candidatus Acidoferrales bacterium]
MNQQVEVAVIGGGCVGTSTTMHLARMGCKDVLLLERDHLAWGATGKSSAIVNLGIWNASEPLTKMLLESIEIFRNFGEKIGGNSGFHPTGWMGLTGKKFEERIKQTVALQRKFGAASTLISPSEIAKLQPGVKTSDLTVAVLESFAGYADPVETTNSFGALAEKLGARIENNAPVKRIKVDGDTKVIETEGGVFKAKKVIVAANVWASKLIGDLGVQLPIKATRKQVCLFKLADESKSPRIIMDDFQNDLYIKPEGDHTLVGEIETPGFACDPDNFNENLDAETTPKLAQKLVERLPAMNAAVSKGGYAGPYDVSPDGHPILDQLPGFDGVYCAVGFSGHGFRFSPATGRLMAEFVLDGKTKGVDVKEFRLNRFTEGKPVQLFA